jgi:hypothetical protein
MARDYRSRGVELPKCHREQKSHWYTSKSSPHSRRLPSAARNASLWVRKTALGAPSARQCEPSESGRGSSWRRRTPLGARFDRPISLFWPLKAPGIGHRHDDRTRP